MYVIIGSHFVPLEGNFFTYSINYCKDNIKCDSASNAPKCLLNNGVSIDNIFATGGNKIVSV